MPGPFCRTYFSSDPWLPGGLGQNNLTDALSWYNIKDTSKTFHQNIPGECKWTPAPNETFLL